MVKKSYKINLRKNIFFSILICFIIRQISAYSVLPKIMPKYGVINEIIEIIMIGLFLFYIFISKYSIRRLITMLVILLTSLISLNTGNRDIFFIGLLLYMSVDIENESIVKVSMITLFFCVSSIVILSFMNIIPNYFYNNALINGSIVKAYCLGFDYYSYVPIYTLFFNCMYIYIRKNKCTYFEILGMIIICIFVNYFCHKELAFYLNLLIISLYVFLCKLKIFKYNNYIFRVISITIIPICFIGIVFFSYNYKKFTIINDILGGRLYYGYEAFNNYNIKLFGQKIEMIGSSTYTENSILNYFYIDSGYLQTLFLRGLIITIIILIGYFAIARKSIKNKQIELFIWLIIVAIYNILGSTLIDIWYNPIFFIGFKYISNWDFTFKLLGKRYRLVYKKY